MNDEEKKLLEETFKLSKENHEMLLKIRSIQKREGVFRILKILLVIAIGAGAFYFVQPYVDAIRSLFENMNNSINELGSFKNSLDVLKNLPR